MAAEMLRLNTSIAPTRGRLRRTRSAWPAATTPASRTAAGPADDVVDLSLRVAMGALCVLTGATDTLQGGLQAGRCAGRRRWR